jgi:SAM-dependent methyltransferase
MLENAKQRLIAGGFTNTDELLFRGNGERTPFENETFNCVVCLGVISYVEQYENIIKEIFRVLKPGGVVLISFRNKYNLVSNDPVGLSKFLIKNTLTSLRLREPDKFKIGRYMDAREVKDTATACGLEFESFKGIGFGPYSFWHKKLFSEDTSIKISRKMTHVADRLGAGFAFRLATDVNILVFRKSEKAS